MSAARSASRAGRRRKAMRGGRHPRTPPGRTNPVGAVDRHELFTGKTPSTALFRCTLGPVAHQRGEREGGAVSAVGVIVAGIDGSNASLCAARWAASDAERRGATLRLVHAVAPMPSDNYPEPLLTRPRVSDRERAAATELLHRTTAQLTVDHPDLNIETAQLDGPPVKVLLGRCRRRVPPGQSGRRLRLRRSRPAGHQPRRHSHLERPTTQPHPGLAPAGDQHRRHRPTRATTPGNRTRRLGTEVPPGPRAHASAPRPHRTEPAPLRPNNRRSPHATVRDGKPRTRRIHRAATRIHQPSSARPRRMFGSSPAHRTHTALARRASTGHPFGRCARKLFIAIRSTSTGTKSRIGLLTNWSCVACTVFLMTSGATSGNDAANRCDISASARVSSSSDSMQPMLPPLAGLDKPVKQMAPLPCWGAEGELAGRPRRAAWYRAASAVEQLPQDHRPGESAEPVACWPLPVEHSIRQAEFGGRLGGETFSTTVAFEHPGPGCGPSADAS